MPSTLKSLTHTQRSTLTALLEIGITSEEVSTALDIPRRSSSRLLENMIREKLVRRERSKPTGRGQPSWMYRRATTPATLCGTCGKEEDDCTCMACHVCGRMLRDAVGLTVASTDELAGRFGDLPRCDPCWAAVAGGDHGQG